MVDPGDHKPLPNGIMGLLCRLHFPAMVAFGRSMEQANIWEHYVAFPDLPDRDDSTDGNGYKLPACPRVKTR